MTEDRKNTAEVPAKRDPRDNLRKGGGRPKGVPNKTTKAIKEMVMAALDQAGGIDYLVRQADENPTAFMTLVGKVLPLQLSGDAENPIRVETIKRVLVDGSNS